jgi:hypothetical protein
LLLAEETATAPEETAAEADAWAPDTIEAADPVAAAAPWVMKYVWTSVGRAVNHAGRVLPTNSEEISAAAEVGLVRANAWREDGRAATREAVAWALEGA